MASDPRASIPLDRLPRAFWCVLAVACLGVIYLMLQVAFVRPYLTGGHGLVLSGDSSLAGSVSRTLPMARPSDIDGEHETRVDSVLPRSPACNML